MTEMLYTFMCWRRFSSKSPTGSSSKALEARSSEVSDLRHAIRGGSAWIFNKGGRVRRAGIYVIE